MAALETKSNSKIHKLLLKCLHNLVPQYLLFLRR